MKLTKVKLLRLLKHSLENDGYIEFKDTLEGAQGLFVKPLENELYLTLGLTISRYYENMFTADYYLSKTTRWGTVWGDIPNKSYERPGCFLTKEERKLLLDEEFNKDGVVDVWWDGFSEIAIRNFLQVIKLTEERFITQKELIEEIRKSKEVEILSLLAKNTIQHVLLNQLENILDFQPYKEIDGIPLIWFKAAETVLKKNGKITNANTVKLLAADAWRQHKLDKMKNSY